MNWEISILDFHFIFKSRDTFRIYYHTRLLCIHILINLIKYSTLLQNLSNFIFTRVWTHAFLYTCSHRYFRSSRIQQRSSNYNIRRGQGGKVSPGREISSLPRAVAEFLSLPWAVRVLEEMVLIFPAVDSRWPRRISRSRQQADEQPRPPPPRSAEIASA